ncbi:MAG: ribosomal RNA small subunit methyltransferase E [Candidatus Hydrogenedentota bacterium]
MPHLHRFFATPEDDDPGRAILRDEEAHHAIHVVRLKPGDEIAVFDGQGRTWIGEIESLSRREVRVRLTGEACVPRPDTQVTLVQAWLHRDKSIEEIIRRCTEIGVDRFVFFPAARSERPPKANSKWNRLAVESCKQCGRVWLPEFHVADSLDYALALMDGPILAATLDGEPVALSDAVSSNRIGFLVGPEGDFTREELARLTQAHATPIGLGATVFRSEVAAVVGCSLVLYELGRLGPRV